MAGHFGSPAITAPRESRAQEWLAPWSNATHLLRTRDWLLDLEPNARLALRLAALTHDAERNFPGSPHQRLDRPGSDWAYRDAHQARSAEMADSVSFLEVYADHAASWMREHGHSRPRIAEQFSWMHSRIIVDRARELARPFHERACAIIAGLSGPSG